MRREIILDTETTGLDPYQGHKLIEIAAIEMENRVLTGAKFHSYINPKRDVPIEAFRIHGISSEFLLDKPLFEEIVDEFLAFIKDGTLIIHNAAFDLKFLNNELAIARRDTIEHTKTLDTLTMARKAFPGKRVNLDALCERFNIDNSGRQFHGALKDAALLAHVYIELLGGRQSKFQFKNKNEQNRRKEERTFYAKRPLVLKPTAQEEAMHNEFIKNFLTRG